MSQKISQIAQIQSSDEDIAAFLATLPGWEAMQYKSFRKWAQFILSQRNLTVGKLEKDFEDGILLYNLLELLAQKKIGKNVSKAKMRIHSVNNLRVSFEFMQKEGIRLENLGVEDVVDGNLKLIMGLLWTLILKYQIGQISAQGKGDGKGGAKAGSAKNWLLDWLKCIAHYRDVKITNLTTSFQDGMAFNALAHLYNNDVVNYDALDKNNRLANLQNAFDILESEYGVPKLLDAKDMAGPEDPDEKSVMTYLAACIAAFDKYEKKDRAGVQRTDASKSLAWGPGVELASTAEKAWFVIQAKDSKGNKITKGGDQFKVKIKGPNGFVDASIVDNNNGTYQVVYYAQVPGSHLIDVTLENKPISNSPIIVEAEYNTEHLNEAYYKWSTAYGAGTELASDAEPATFTIQAKNKYGNEVTKGGDAFKTQLKSPAGAPEVSPTVVDNQNGTYGVTYQIKAPGDYTGDVTLGGQSIFNSPFNVLGEHNTERNTQTEPRWSSASGSGLVEASTIQQANFTITSKNKYGNNVGKGGDAYDLSIQSAGGRKVAHTLKDNNDGTYSVTYQPTVGGNHGVRISLKGTPILNSPYTVPVSQKTDPSKTIAFGAGTEVGSTAEPAVFTIQARDGAGNNVNRGGDKVRVSISHKGAEEVEAETTDNGDGTYTVTYQPIVPGVHQVEVKINGGQVQKSPFNVKVDFNVDPANIADPKWSVAYGPGVELASTAEVATFTVEARNKYGNKLKSGGDTFDVSLKSASGPETKAHVTDNKNGTYSVQYKAAAAGQLDVGVSLKGTPISGSPHRVVVDQNSAAINEADARWTSAYGPGRDAANTATPAALTVQAKNKYGNNVNKGGDDVRLKVLDTNGRLVDTDAKDNGNGTYSVSYRPTSSGAHRANITLGGSSIHKSPFDVKVTQDTDAKKSKAFGPGVELASTAEPAVFTIQAVDTVGNLLNRGGDNFKVRISGPEQLNATVADNNDGTYTVTYHPKTAGEYTISTTLDGVPISNSPVKVKVEQQASWDDVADAKWSTAYGAGTEIGSTAEKSEFKIQAKNKYGNNITKGGHEFNVEFQGAKGPAGFERQIVDNEDGTYTVTYQATAPGSYVGDVSLNSKSIHNSPFKVLIEGNSAANEEADPKWSTAVGDGLNGADTTKAAPFTIIARNRYGNQLTKGGSDFKLRIKGFRGRPVKSTLKDNNDGTYSASYQPTASGKHLVDIKLEGKSINRFPKPVPVTQVTDASKTLAKGAGTVIGSTAEVAEFTIQAKDAVGNNCNRGGDKFKVSVAGPAGSPPVEAKVKDNSDGTYTVRYNPSVPGVHTIDVSLDGKPISNSPLRANIELNSEPNTAVDAKWSTASGPATELTSIAEHGEFTIQAKNKYGNPVASSSPFAVAIKGPEGSPSITPIVTDNKNGSFLVKYKPFVPGDHSVSVSLNGAGIFETPVTAVAEHNTKFDEVADARWSEATGAGVEQANTSDHAKFTIQAKNRYGNIVRNGGSDFRVAVKSATGSEVDANVKDNANGTYSVDYQPSASGDHAVEVTLDDWHIYRSPFIVPVTQGTDASKSFAFGAGVELGSTAEPSTFTIQAVDKLGNKVTRGGDSFKTTIVAANNSALPSQTKDNLSGTYNVTYQPTVAGTYTVSVTLGGQQILRSPYKPVIELNTSANEIADPKWSTVAGPGTESCATGEPANFSVIAKNKYGNQLKKGGDAFDVKIQGPNGAVQPTIADNGDGTYAVQYQPKVAGEHQFNVTLKGQSIFGCPFKVNAEQTSGANQEASAKFSTASGDGLKSATTIAPAEFKVQAKNKFGNNLTKGGNDVKVAVKGPRGSAPVVASVKDNNDGTYSITYQPNAGGKHTVSVLLDGAPIQNAPFDVPVSQVTEAAQSTVDGAGISIASTAEPASFVIQARDKLGNKCNRGGDPFQVKIKTPQGSEPVEAKVHDNRDGTYTVTYQPKVAGVHEVDISLENKPVGKGTYQVQVEHNDAANTTTDPKWSFAHGAGVELASTAEPSEFVIQARNKYGNNIKTGGDPFKPAVSSQAGAIPFGLVDNQNGTYLVTYQANVPGLTTVAVTLNGAPIKGSPYQVTVDKNTSVDTEADSKWTGVLEDGIDKANIIEPSEFTLQARNKYGNKVNKGGDDFGVSVSNNAGQVGSTITDNGDGTYSVSYQPTTTGDHLLDITLQGSSINKFPLDVNVTQGTDPSKCVPFGPGFESAVVGEPNTFTIQAKDKNWNNVKNGGDAFAATVKGPNGASVPVTVADNNDGTYSVTYTPTTPGYHDVDVTLDGEAIAYCPFSVPAKQQTAASHTALTGPGIESATTTEPAVFTIQAKDKTGNNLPIGGDDFYVKVTPPPGSKPVIASVVDNGDGTYTVEYQPNAPGNHTVEVLLNDDLVGGKALTVPVTQTTDPSKTVAYGPGFEDSSTGNPAIFMVRAKDSKGNNVLRGGDAFKATLTAPGGATVPGTIKDNNNGTYVVTFQPTTPGNHVLDISLDGKPISNSPSTILVRQDVDPSKSVISGPGLEKANTSDLATFVIEARDSNGSKVSRGGEKFDVKVTVASNGFPLQPTVKDNKDGTYSVTYQAFAPGKHDISVTLAGKPVGRSPVSINVEAGPATVMSEFEMEVWREINKARMSPALYAAYLRELVPNYDAASGAFTLPDSSFARQTQEGRKALYEAIRALEEMSPIAAIKINESFSYSCRDLVADLGPKGATGNVMSDGTSPADRLNKYGRWKGKVTEIINYGGITPKDVVASWIVDDGLPDRPNRRHLFDQDFTVAGIASGPHTQALRMCVVALAGNYLEGEEPPKPPREITIKKESETLSFDRFETKDKSGYLIPVGKLYTDIDKVKVFKEGKTVHIERTILHAEDNTPMLSHFRYEVPFDFDPITVLAKFNSLNTDMSFFITKPAGAPDPNTEVVLTTYSLGPTKGRKNEKMEFSQAENDNNWLFECKSSSCLEDLTIKLKGKTLTFVSERHIIEEDEEGEYETISKSTRTVNLPYQVPLAAFSLQGHAKESFTLKITKPTSTVDPNAQIEIPVREGYFDF